MLATPPRSSENADLPERDTREATLLKVPREVCELALAHVNRDRWRPPTGVRTCSSGDRRSWSRGPRLWPEPKARDHSSASVCPGDGSHQGHYGR